ncbi:MAG: hypothetical protein HeimC3_10660 [Candidatus Heimdallarchaeota archaeon LC_3]|nr:MAG: hypothetical protein HeimC3_10660 [Candidatus Heimdallarchaeota archaeon LC_3]
MEDAYITDDKKKMDETLMGGFIAALFSFSKSVSSGIDTISMGEIIMHYASGNGIITCLAVNKKVKGELAQETVKKIHIEFLEKFSSAIAQSGSIDTTIFNSFKDFCKDLLLDMKLLPKGFEKDNKEAEKISEESSKVRRLIQTVIEGEDPKRIAKDLRSMFSILGSSKDGKEFRKVLVEFDKFIDKLQIEKTISKQLMSLISEIRSFATINEWLG